MSARLLQRLHESLGDEATNDLFSWWEEAATVNRAAVREVADLYYARFDARLEKGLAEVRAELAKESGQLRTEMAKELGQVRSEMSEGSGRVRSEMAEGFGKVRSEMAEELAQVRTEMAEGLAQVRTEMAEGFGKVRSEMAGQRADLVKWMFAFWAGTIVPLAGLVIALIRL